MINLFKCIGRVVFALLFFFPAFFSSYNKEDSFILNTKYTLLEAWEFIIFPFNKDKETNEISRGIKT
jgi:hypothetical protein